MNSKYFDAEKQAKALKWVKQFMKQMWKENWKEFLGKNTFLSFFRILKILLWISSALVCAFYFPLKDFIYKITGETPFIYWVIINLCYLLCLAISTGAKNLKKTAWQQHTIQQFYSKHELFEKIGKLLEESKYSYTPHEFIPNISLLIKNSFIDEIDKNELLEQWKILPYNYHSSLHNPPIGAVKLMLLLSSKIKIPS